MRLEDLAGQHVRVAAEVGANPGLKIGSIKYPNAIYDEKSGEWISDAEIAKVPYTASASKRAHRTDGELIVRRVRRLNPSSAPQGQGTPSPAARRSGPSSSRSPPAPPGSGRDSITWHLPQNWPWQDAWLNAFDDTHRAPPAVAA